jgi:hypothetical protein
MYAQTAHPRMFFDYNDTARLRQQSKSTHKDIWTPILQKANSLAAAGVPSFPAPQESLFQAIGNNIYTTAFAYIITGDKKYLNITKSSLLAMASWQYWSGDNQYLIRDFGLQYMIRGNALAYDWVYNDLNGVERDLIRKAIARHSSEMYNAATAPKYIPEWNNWWRRSYNQNHWSSNNAALGIAALVLLNEVDSAQIWLNHVTQQLSIRTDIYNGIKDGSWHEGMQYQNADLLFTFPFYYNLKRIKNVDIIAHDYFRNFAIWKIYNYIPGSSQSVLSYGDYMPDWGGGYGWAGNVSLAFVANIENSGYAQWMYQKSIEALPSWGRAADDAAYWIYEFLYFNPSVSALLPDNLPLSKTFKDLDCAIWRTGWGNNDLIFGLYNAAFCGRYMRDNYLANIYPGHDHQDALTYYLYKGKYDLTSEMPENIFPFTPNTHNTILVNEKEQFYSAWGKMFHNVDGYIESSLSTQTYNFLIADASSRFKETIGPGDPPGNKMVDELRRFVLVSKPDYLILIDNIRAGVANQYDWLCHFSEQKPGPITVSNNWVKGPSADDVVLGVNIIAPQKFVYEVDTNKRPWTTPAQTKPYIKLHPETNLSNTRFITLLLPSTESSWNVKPITTLLSDDTLGSAVRVNYNDLADHVFNYSKVSDSIKSGEYRLKGTTATLVTDKTGKLRRIFLGNGKSFYNTNGTKLLAESDKLKSTFEIEYKSATLNFFCDSIYHIRIYAPQTNADSVFCNGKKIAASKTDDYIYFNSIASAVQNLKDKEFEIKIYPNPAQNLVNIEFSMPTTDHVSIVLYEISGRIVQNMENRRYMEGYHSIRPDISNLKQGIYLLELKIGNTIETRKFIKL